MAVPPPPSAFLHPFRSRFPLFCLSDNFDLMRKNLLSTTEVNDSFSETPSTRLFPPTHFDLSNNHQAPRSPQTMSADNDQPFHHFSVLPFFSPKSLFPVPSAAPTEPYPGIIQTNTAPRSDLEPPQQRTPCFFDLSARNASPFTAFFLP